MADKFQAVCHIWLFCRNTHFYNTRKMFIRSVHGYIFFTLVEYNNIRDEFLTFYLVFWRKKNVSILTQNTPTVKKKSWAFVTGDVILGDPKN